MFQVGSSSPQADSFSATDPATRGCSLLMGHREPTYLQGYKSRALPGRIKGLENSLLLAITIYTFLFIFFLEFSKL